MNLKKFIKNNLFIILLLLLVFILRLPSLFEPYWYGDETIYLIVGKGLRNGMSLYKDLFDNKPPMIYILAAVADGNIFWFRMILLVSCLATIGLFWQFTRKIFVVSRPAKLATVLFALLTTIRLFEGNLPNAEIFILLPTIFSLNILWPYFSQKKSPKLGFLIIGVILGIGLLFKVTSLFDLAAIILFWALLSKPKKMFCFKKEQLLLILGYLLPIVLTSLYFLTQNAFKIFFESCFLQTSGYISSWETKSHAFSVASLLKTDLFLKGFIFLLILIFLWSKRQRISLMLGFTIIWFLTSLFVAGLTQRPYPHYLMQTVPAVCLLFGILFTQKPAYLVCFSLFTLYLIVFFRYRFWYYPTIPYYKNFIEFAAGRKNKNQYLEYFDQQLPSVYKISEMILALTKPKDKIFVWGNQPSYYLLSNNLPSTPYVVAYHVIDLKKEQTVENDLSQNPPTVIIIQNDFPQQSFLRSITGGRYIKFDTINNTDIYRIVR